MARIKDYLKGKLGWKNLDSSKSYEQSIDELRTIMSPPSTYTPATTVIKNSNLTYKTLREASRKLAGPAGDKSITSMENHIQDSTTYGSALSREPLTETINITINMEEREFSYVIDGLSFKLLENGQPLTATQTSLLLTELIVMETMSPLTASGSQLLKITNEWLTVITTEKTNPLSSHTTTSEEFSLYRIWGGTEKTWHQSSESQKRQLVEHAKQMQQMQLLKQTSKTTGKITGVSQYEPTAEDPYGIRGLQASSMIYDELDQINTKENDE